MKNNHVREQDLVTSVVLFFAGLFIFKESVALSQISLSRDISFWESAGLTPGLLGILLVFCSILLFVQSVKKFEKGTLRSSMKEWAVGLYQSKAVRAVVIGALIIGAYTMILFRFLPFWLCSFATLVYLFIHLKATTWKKAAIISGIAVGAVVILFEYIFHVPLP